MVGIKLIVIIGGERKLPKEFIKCVREGGRVRTIKPKGESSRKYMKVCYKSGKSYAGEVKTRKK